MAAGLPAERIEAASRAAGSELADRSFNIPSLSDPGRSRARRGGGSCLPPALLPASKKPLQMIWSAARLEVA